MAFKAPPYVSGPITKLLLFVLESLPKTKDAFVKEVLSHYSEEQKPDEILEFDLTEKSVPNIASLPKDFVARAESGFSLKFIEGRSPEISLCFYFDGPIVGSELDATSNLIKPRDGETSFRTIRPLSNLHKGIRNLFLEFAVEAGLAETKANHVEPGKFRFANSYYSYPYDRGITINFDDLEKLISAVKSVDKKIEVELAEFRETKDYVTYLGLDAKLPSSADRRNR